MDRQQCYNWKIFQTIQYLLPKLLIKKYERYGYIQPRRPSRVSNSASPMLMAIKVDLLCITDVSCHEMSEYHAATAIAARHRS